MEADILVPAFVLGIEDGTANEIPKEGQKPPADKSLPGNRIAGQIDVSEGVNASVAHFRPLGGDAHEGKKAQKVQRNQKKPGASGGCGRGQHQNSQGCPQGEQGIFHAVFKIHKPDAQHHAKQRHPHRGIVGAEDSR